MTFEVERAGGGAESKVVTLEATPEPWPPWIEPLDGDLQDVPGLGLAFPVRTKIVSVVPGSAADRAGLRVGSVISKVTLAPPPEIKGAKPTTIVLNDKPPGWVSVFWLLQGRPPQEVEISVDGSSKPIRIKPEPVADWYNSDRGLTFQVLSRRLPPLGVEAALRRGFDDTIESIVRIYAMLRSLVQGRVSPKLLGGPIMIAATAYRSADTGMTYLIHFLGILSINLAVLNFLPIPPLDGGQFVFLLAEWVRGRPVPEAAVNVVSWMGILLLLGLMLYVMYQDILRQIGF
jgi:regulator of sigma E protease